MVLTVKCWDPDRKLWYPSAALTGSDSPDERDAVVLQFGREVMPAHRHLIEVPIRSAWSVLRDLLRAGYAVVLDDGLPIKDE